MKKKLLILEIYMKKIKKKKIHEWGWFSSKNNKSFIGIICLDSLFFKYYNVKKLYV